MYLKTYSIRIISACRLIRPPDFNHGAVTYKWAMFRNNFNAAVGFVVSEFFFHIIRILNFISDHTA